MKIEPYLKSLKFLLMAGALCAGLPTDSHAHAGRNRPADFIETMDRENIQAFLDEVKQITSGNRPDMLDEDVINYFANHLPDDGRYESTIEYEIPGYPTEEITMRLGKIEYINGVVNARYMMQDYQATVDILELDISHSGKKAVLKTVTTETGLMPAPEVEGEEDNQAENIPVRGRSECTQELVVSSNNFIQLKKADCATVISFDPFQGQSLRDQGFRP